MNNQNEQQILALLPSSFELCSKAARWVYKQPMGVFLIIKKKEQETYFRLKQHLKHVGVELPVEAISVTATLTTAYHFHRLVTKLDSGGDDDGKRFEALADVEKIELASTRKQRVRKKMEKLKTMQSTIRMMVEEGRSLRGMAKHILSKHRFEVSHSTLQTFIRENITVEEDKDGNEV